MVIHLGIQDALGERLFQAVKKSVRIKGRLRIRPSQQLVQDGIRNMRLFASRHGWAPFHPSCPPKHEIPDSLRIRRSPWLSIGGGGRSKRSLRPPRPAASISRTLTSSPPTGSASFSLWLLWPLRSPTA